MGIVSQLLQEELIDLNCKSVSVEEFFAEKAKVLRELGYVTDTYETALLEREKEYPTGLEMAAITIAIPHTMPEHIKKPFIYFNRLTQKGMQFIQMGTDDVVVEPQYILMLGITNPREQVALLAELMDLFNGEEFIDALVQAKSAQDILTIFNK